MEYIKLISLFPIVSRFWGKTTEEFTCFLLMSRWFHFLSSVVDSLQDDPSDPHLQVFSYSRILHWVELTRVTAGNRGNDGVWLLRWSHQRRHAFFLPLLDHSLGAEVKCQVLKTFKSPMERPLWWGAEAAGWRPCEWDIVEMDPPVPSQA